MLIDLDLDLKEKTVKSVRFMIKLASAFHDKYPEWTYDFICNQDVQFTSACVEMDEDLYNIVVKELQNEETSSSESKEEQTTV